MVYLHSTAGLRIGIKVPGLVDRKMFAIRQWVRLGGRPVVRRTLRSRASARRAELRAQREAELRQAQESLRAFLSGRACSGGVLPRIPESDRFEVVLAPRGKRPRVDLEWERGLKADKRGRWAAEEILAVRRSADGGRGWDALVSWVGPFDPEWIPCRNLCGPAKAEAKAIIACLRPARNPGPSIDKVTEVVGGGDQKRVRRSPRFLALETRERIPARLPSPRVEGSRLVGTRAHV